MTDQVLSTRLGSRFAGEMASALVAVLKSADRPEAIDGPASWPGVLMSVKVTGAQSGLIMAWVESTTATAAARAAKGGEGEVTEDVILGFLRDEATKVGETLAGTPEFAGLRFSVSATSSGPAPDGASLYRCVLPDGTPGAVGASASIAGASEAASARASSNLDIVLDVELPLVVRFGRTVLSLKALSALGPGSIVEMGRSPDDPVELLVSDRVIAYGEVVIVDGSYGLRVTDLVSRSDRLRAMESR